MLSLSAECWQQGTLLNTRRHETSCHFYIKPCLLARPGPGPLQQLDSRPSVQLARVQLVSRALQFLHPYFRKAATTAVVVLFQYNTWRWLLLWLLHFRKGLRIFTKKMFSTWDNLFKCFVCHNGGFPKVSMSNVRSSSICQPGDQGSYIDRAESGRNHFRGGIRHSQMGLREERMVSWNGRNILLVSSTTRKYWNLIE